MGYVDLVTGLVGLVNNGISGPYMIVVLSNGINGPSGLCGLINGISGPYRIDGLSNGISRPSGICGLSNGISGPYRIRGLIRNPYFPCHRYSYTTVKRNFPLNFL